MSIIEKPLINGVVVDRPARRPRLGLVRGTTIERAFIIGLYLAAVGLVLLSVFGTFYGIQGRAAPMPWQMPADAIAAPGLFLAAAAVQGVLTLLQWGARQMGRHDSRWWAVYLAALAWSVYYNVVAYYAPAVALGAPWLVVGLLIIAADAVPEFMVIKD